MTSGHVTKFTDPLAPPTYLDSQGKPILAGDSTRDTIATPHPKDDYLIVPAKSIGKIDLGMQQEVALAALGTPDSSDAAMGTFVYTWLAKTGPYRAELNLVTGYADEQMKQRVVKMVRTTSPYFLTGSGMGVQKNLAEIKKEYPLVKLVKTYSSTNHRAEIEMYADEGVGILFECLSSDQKLCVGLQVFKPGNLPAMEF